MSPKVVTIKENRAQQQGTNHGVSGEIWTIEGVADCEIRYVIRFVNTRNVLPSEIHYQICQVYGDNSMIDPIKQSLYTTQSAEVLRNK